MGDSYTSKDIIDMTQQLQKRKNAGKKAKKEGDKKKAEDKAKTEAKPEEAWSEEQQKSLEVGLKKYPKTLPPKERWDKISKEVGDKTPKE